MSEIEIYDTQIRRTVSTCFRIAQHARKELQEAGLTEDEVRNISRQIIQQSKLSSLFKARRDEVYNSMCKIKIESVIVATLNLIKKMEAYEEYENNSQDALAVRKALDETQKSDG